MNNSFCNNGCRNVSLMIHKINGLSGIGIPGAVFELIACNGFTCSGTTNSQGLLKFYIMPCHTYLLKEVSPPAGFEPVDHIFSICVNACGCIVVDGVLTSQLLVENTPIAVSALPTINTIYEGTPFISGTGVPGSDITVTLPNGSTVAAIVGANETWRVSVPSGVELVVGNVVSAVQTESGKLPSNQVFSTVVAVFDPFLEKTIENLTSPGESARPGDTLQFTILIGNLGGAGSVWTNAVLTDFIIEDLTFIPGTVAVDGQLIPVGIGVGQYTYDSVTRTLTINVGDLASGEIKAVTFQVTVNLDVAGEEIVNTVTASNISVPGTAPDITASTRAPIIAR